MRYPRNVHATPNKRSTRMPSCFQKRTSAGEAASFTCLLRCRHAAAVYVSRSHAKEGNEVFAGTREARNINGRRVFAVFAMAMLTYSATASPRRSRR